MKITKYVIDPAIDYQMLTVVKGSQPLSIIMQAGELSLFAVGNEEESNFEVFNIRIFHDLGVISNYDSMSYLKTVLYENSYLHLFLDSAG